MPTFQQYINKINPDLDVNKKGAIVDPGPYEGFVKNNSDTRRTGRMDVYIPALGGIPSDPRSWTPVKYMSPFLGTTDKKLIDNKIQYISKSTLDKKIIPNFLIDKTLSSEDLKTLLSGLKLVSDYLEKTILKPNNLNQPISRLQFINILR